MVPTRGLGLPRTFGVDDLPLILQDRQFDSEGSIEYDNKTLGALEIVYGARGDTVIVNGAIAPVARVPAGLVRLRLLNAANAQNFELRFSDRRTFHVIASDGGFLSAPIALKQLIYRAGRALRSSWSTSRTESPSCWKPAPMSKWVFSAGWRRMAAPTTCPVMRFEPTATTAAIKQLPSRLIEPAPVNPGVRRSAAAARSQQRSVRQPSRGGHPRRHGFSHWNKREAV